MTLTLENIALGNEILDHARSRHFLDPLDPYKKGDRVFDRWCSALTNSGTAPNGLPHIRDTFKAWSVGSYEDAAQLAEVISGVPHGIEHLRTIPDDPNGPLFICIWASFRTL